MAELFRVNFKLNRCGWMDKDKNWLVDEEGLKNNIKLPEDTKSIDLVVHDRPSKDRFVSVIDEDGDGMFLEVQRVKKCDRHYGTHVIFDTIPKRETDTIHKNIMKSGLKKGDKVYLQIEY